MTESVKQSEQAVETISTKNIRGISLWLSEKGVKFVLAPMRGAWTSVNPKVAQTILVSGAEHWFGSFISPDIDYIEREPKQGGKKPTIIHLTNGEVWSFDGKQFTKMHDIRNADNE